MREEDGGDDRRPLLAWQEVFMFGSEGSMY